MADEPRLGVVVVNFASHSLLEDLPRSVCGHYVVVVDSFSSDDERDAVARVASRHGWDLCLLEENHGFGAAVNEGVRRAAEAGCDVLLLLNPDAAVAPDVVDELARQVRDDPTVVVSPRIDRPDGRAWFRGSDLDLRTGRTRTTQQPTTCPWLTATVLALHVSAWGSVGGFDPDYFMYWEDVDLSYRLRRAGARLVVRQDLTAVHAVGGTQDGVGHAKSALYYRWNCRGRLLFAAKHLPPRSALRWVLGAPAYAREVLYRGGRRQLLDVRGTLLPAAAGTLDGIRAVAGAAVRGRRGRRDGVAQPRSSATAAR